MNFKKLSLAAILSGAFVMTGCPTDDTGGTGDTDGTETTPTTMTMTEGPTTTPMTTTGPTTTGPSTTDPDTTETATDTMDTDDTDDTDTTGPDPDVYDFRDDGPEAYTAVDRMGFPAVNTALIAPANKDAYNALTPEDDVGAANSLADIAGSLNFLHVGPEDGTGPTPGLNDDLEFVVGALVDAGAIEAGDLAICRHPASAKIGDECQAQAGRFVFPDVLLLDTTAESGFPNGRALEVPVIDIILSVLLLDVIDEDTGTEINDLFSLLFFTDLDADTDGNQGLSQAGNDLPFGDSFPYLAPAHEMK